MTLIRALPLLDRFLDSFLGEKEPMAKSNLEERAKEELLPIKETETRQSPASLMPSELMLPEQEEACKSPPLRALAYIGLDMSGPGGASMFQIGIYSLLIFIPIA